MFISCGTQQKNKESGASLSHRQTNKYATYFKIYTEKNFTVLITYLNTNKTDSITYILYATEKPQLSIDAYYIKTPVTSVACLSSVFVGALNNIQCLNYITAVDNADYICNPFVQKKCSNNTIQQLSKNGVLNIEQTIICKPQIIFANPSGDSKKDFDTRLLNAGITPIICADYFENNPLARAEWAKAYAIFFNAEQRADSIFSSIETHYLQFKTMADTCVRKPTLFSELKTGDAWFVPGAKSYVAQLFKDAGATYIFADNDKTGSLSLNMEQVVDKAINADYWLNLHYCRTTQDLIKQDKRYEVFNAYKKRNLYNNNAFVNETDGNAYWEYGLNHPDEILTDMIKIVHPALLPNHTLKYYKQLTDK